MSIKITVSMPSPGVRMEYLKSIAEIRKLFAAADYVGIKTVDSEDELEGFLVKTFSYRPTLIRLLYFVTAVRYKHWTGPVYFNLIRLFNLLLVNRMAHHAARFAASPPSK